MSDTPRTDLLLIVHDIDPKPGTIIAHARQLERELNAAQATIRQQQLLDEEIMRLWERVKRLEKAGDAMCETYEEIGMDSFDRERIAAWKQAREAKP